MKKYLLLFVALLSIAPSLIAQELSWSPQFPTAISPITITLDASKGNAALAGFAGPVYVHIGVITNLSTSSSDWKHAPTWLDNTAPYTTTNCGTNKWCITIANPTTYFNLSAGETIQKIAILFRDATGAKKQANTDGSDMYVPIYSTTNNVRITAPTSQPTYTRTIDPIIPTPTAGSVVPVTAVSSVSGTLSLSLNGTAFATATGSTISGNATAVIGNNQIIASLNGTAYDTVNFFVTPTTIVAPLPTGVVEGINYYNCTDSVTLVLYAPNKTSVVLLGDFTNWISNANYLMKKTPDGNYYWITIHGLTSGTEYAYQYLVDNSIYIADPYCEKVLDPWNDKYIPATTYPSLKSYPAAAAQGTNGIVSVLQICEPQYTWQVPSFTKPDKRNLMIYELNVRDFSARKTTYSVVGNYQDVIDSIQYLKKLGINAVEFMPLDEFGGNDSWGYNPDYHYATDKTYGTKNKLKELIDLLHQNGMAAIVDVVWDDLASNTDPQAKLYWNATTNLPATDNPWLNPFKESCPYGVFQNEDINHSAAATQYWVQRSLEHWITEFKADGFRFDLGKGFSNTWLGEGVYDAARVANLEKHYDYITGKYPNTYMILEFLGGLPSSEEQEYAKHGFMCWGEMFSQYAQCSMGFSSNFDIGPLVWNYSNRNYPSPYLVGYPESHDKERMMYQNEKYGNSSGTYNVKNLATGLERMEAVGATLFTVPGPKMIWQFEERGYDSSIASNGGNTSSKLPMWNYMQDPNRKHLYDAWAKMIQFRIANPNVFTNSPTSYDYNSSLYKIFSIGDPAIANTQVVVVANFDVTSGTKTVIFPKTGNWYNLISNTGVGVLSTAGGLNGATGTTLSLTNTSQSITLAPGEYHIYVSGSPCSTPAPTATSPISYCQNATATALTATGTALMWYTSATGSGGTTSITPSTSTIGTTTFYVSQTVGCESARTPVVVNITAGTPMPTVSTPINYCQNVTASALSATGTNLKWYTSATGTGSTTVAPTPSTSTVGSITYYVSQTQSCGESPRAAIVVNVSATPTAPSVVSPVNYCQNSTATALSATGTNLLWYSTATATGGVSATPTPITTAVGSVTYYVSQTSNGCESPRSSILVNVNAIPSAPTTTSPINYCQNAAATALTATGTGLMWYTSATGTGGTTSITPSTTTIGSTTFYVSQSSNNCESARTPVVVNITAGTPTPTVTTPVNYCRNSTASALSATGTNLKWYTSATGTGSTTVAPTPSTSTTGSVTFYVSQTQSCGESPRAAIVVNVNAIPSAPSVVSPVNNCQNSTATALSATGANLLWYSTATGTGGVSATPTPVTTTVGSVTYYVSQTSNGCESPRSSILVNTNITPSAPTVVSPISYCQNATATALTATGTGLLWYTSATGTGGTGTAPTPSTVTAGTVNYYVSQTTGVCESPRSIIAVTVNPLPTAPAVTSPVSYCQNAQTTALSATGTNLKWYTSATGTGSTTVAPTPTSTTAGNTTYYVSQTGSCGESPRAAIIVSITPAPLAPTGLTVTNVTNTAATLSWATVIDAVLYTVKYKALTEAAWTTITTTTNTTTITTLTRATAYQWTVTANCSTSTDGINTSTGTPFTTKSYIVTNIKNGLGIAMYPNPMATTGKIVYVVPAAGMCYITLYNDRGRRIDILLNQNIEAAGQYELSLPAVVKQLPPGIYFLKIFQGSNTNYTKIIIP